MQYALLIYAASTAFPSEDEQDKVLAAYRAYTEMLQEAGAYGGAVRLTDSTSATSVRVRDGKTVTTDGPYAETEEQLAGLFIVDCADLDEALEYAAQLPGAKLGTVEVRPISYLNT